MKILFVATDYPEREKPRTGFPNYLYRVSLALLHMGHKPIILAAGSWDNYRNERGIDIWTVQVKQVDCHSQTLNYLINALHKGYILNKRVKTIINKMNVDVVQFTSLEGLALLYTGNVPAVMRLSSYAKIAFASFQTCSFWTVWAMSQLERLSAYRCNAIFAPCKNTGILFGRDSGRKVYVIETPFINDVQYYDNRYVDEYLKGKKYALFFGTFYAEKGILVIAEILERFLENNPDYLFVFIGSTFGKSFTPLLKRKAGRCINRLVIWDALPHKQLYPVIKHADFVVLPSYMENLSNACIEAMYFGKVVIGTNGSSFEQLITHKKSGLLCKIGDSEDLLKKMQMAVAMDAEQKLQMGKQAISRINNLKPEYVVKKLLRLYEHVINDKGNDSL